MKKMIFLLVAVFSISLSMPQTLLAGNGFMGGKGKIVVEDEPNPDDGGIPDTVEGPLSNKGSDAGKLFGDLYRIIRYQGIETKMVPEIDSYGLPVCRDLNGNIALCESTDSKQYLVSGSVATGGEPKLSEGYGIYALEVAEGEYEIASSPYPSQCVQPVANFKKWGDIWQNPTPNGTQLNWNRLPLVMTYDATWGRTECEVGELLSVTIDTATGALTYDINEYFVKPMDMWNGVTYCDGVKWVDLVDEVNFGRLNISRSPEAVLQAAFDEAIRTINKADIIERDAAGRLLLTTSIYEESQTSYTEDAADCSFKLIETVTKAIDSPLENIALYIKLMKDGHLVTPGDEREPIDRSEKGGIPLWKMLEIEDGPSSTLRPAINMMDPLNPWQSKLAAAFPNLVDVKSPTYYVAYYECYNDEAKTNPVPCLCQDVKPDGTPTWVMCPNVISRDLVAVPGTECPPGKVCNDENGDGKIDVWYGIITDDCPNNNCATGKDFDFAAAFLAAAADKSGEIGVDMVVYINSILGLNQVVGYSEYDADGNPTSDAIDYAKAPNYFNFNNVTYGDSGRVGLFQNRGNSTNPAGTVTVLTGGPSIWTVENVYILKGITFDNLGIDSNTGMPDESVSDIDIAGFSQMANDNLKVVDFIHTYQIPGLR